MHDLYGVEGRVYKATGRPKYVEVRVRRSFNGTESGARNLLEANARSIPNADASSKFGDDPRIYMWPAKTKFVQTPEAVYILYQYGDNFRQVWLNRKHPDDPDSTWWGESIAWCENDTLVVDTVGFNDKTWLDQMGHPHTDKLHLIERYKRVDANTLELDMTIDDPGAYTKPWYAHRNFTISKSGQWYQWICTVEENQHFFDNQGAPAVSSPPNK